MCLNNQCICDTTGDDMIFIGEKCLFKCYDCILGDCYNDINGVVKYCSKCVDPLLIKPLCDTCSKGVLVELKCLDIEKCDTIDCRNGVCYFNDSKKVNYFCLSCHEKAIEVEEAGVLHCASDCSTYFMDC